jgi:hypothetical protein
MVNTTTMKKEEEEEKKARVEPPLWALAAFEDCGLLEVRGLPLPLQRERERGAGLAHARVVLEVRGLPLPLQREREREREELGWLTRGWCCCRWLPWVAVVAVRRRACWRGIRSSC